MQRIRRDTSIIRALGGSGAIADEHVLGLHCGQDIHDCLPRTKTADRLDRI